MSDDEFIIVNRRVLTPEITEISQWLEPTPYEEDSSDFKKHLDAHIPGTGDWLEKTSEYQKWHDEDPNGLLWIKAIAGAGKSVLTASHIARLQKHEPRAVVLFFFVRHIVRANHESQALVRDWLDQLLPFSPSLQSDLKSLKSQFKNIAAVGLADLWNILTDTLLATPHRIYCIVDALDELEDEKIQDLAERLVKLATEKPASIKVLVSSRPLPQIQQVLGRKREVLPVRLENRIFNKDIAYFISHRLEKAQELPEDVRSEMKLAIEDRVFPSFLYARLMLNELLDHSRRYALDKGSVAIALRSIPASLEELYSYMLNVNSARAGVPKERQMLILQLVIHATRPLRLLEIATVFAFLGISDSEKTQGNVKQLTRVSCGPLLEILPDETVFLIHHSFTEFLLGSNRAKRANLPGETFPVISSDKANHKMAMISLEYLMSSGLKIMKRDRKMGLSNLLRQPWEDMQRAQFQSPFTEYAACNWYIHVSRLPVIHEELQELLRNFITPHNPSFLAFADLVMKFHISQSEPVALLNICAWGNMTTYAKILLESGHDVNSVDYRRMTPVADAADRGYHDMVALLLEAGANPNPEPGQSGKRPLHYAARRNDETIVKLLLEAGADLRARRSKRYDPLTCVVGGMPNPEKIMTPFEEACSVGATRSLQAMLPFLDQNDLNLAMRWSIKESHYDTVKWLSDLPTMKMDMKHLTIAAEKKNPPIFKLILGWITRFSKDLHKDAGLLFTFCYSDWSMRFSRQEHTDELCDCLDMILEAGCDVNQHSKGGSTALHQCVLAKCPDFVDKLLEHGADVHAVDENGNTPLHLVNLEKEFGQNTGEPIVHSLMRAGARLDVRNNITEKGGVGLPHCLLGAAMVVAYQG